MRILYNTFGINIITKIILFDITKIAYDLLLIFSAAAALPSTPSFKYIALI